LSRHAMIDCDVSRSSTAKRGQTHIDFAHLELLFDITPHDHDYL